MTSSSSTSTPPEADRRVAVRIAVGEGRVVDDRDARRGCGRRGTASGPSPSRVGHHDVDRRDVAVGDEPLLAVDHPAAVAPQGGRRDPRRVRAGVLLGDGVSVVELAAQRRAQPALDLLRRAHASTLYALGTYHESALVERPNCSSSEDPFELDQPWPPSPARAGRRQPAAIAASLIRSPPPRAAAPPTLACTSRGISTSSANRRARACSSACAGVSSSRVERDAHTLSGLRPDGARCPFRWASRARSRFHRWWCRIRFAALWLTGRHRAAAQMRPAPHRCGRSTGITYCASAASSA